MGKGNAIIRDREGNHFPTYLIEQEDLSEEGKDISADFFDLLTDLFMQCVSKSISTEVNTYSDSYRNDYRSICSTDRLELVITDNETSLALGIIPGGFYEDEEGYDESYVEKMTEKFVKKLLKHYPNLRIRTGPWTSGLVKTSK